MAIDPVSTSRAKSGQGWPPGVRILALLRDRRFCPLLVVQMSAVFNAGLLVTSSINVDVTLLQVFGIFIVALLVSGVAGQVVDKYENVRLLRIVKAFEVPVVGLACLGLAMQSAVLVTCALGVLTVLLTFLMHARHVLLSRLMAEDELVGGNTLLVAGGSLSLIGGVLPVVLIGDGVGRFVPWIFLVCVAAALVGYMASRELPAGRPADTGAAISFNPLTWLVRNGLAHGVERTSLFALFGVAWFWLSSMLLFAQLWRLLGPESGAQSLLVQLAVVAFCGVIAGLCLSVVLSEGLFEFGLVPVGAVGQAFFTLDLVFLSTELATSGGAATDLPGISPNWRALADLFAFVALGSLSLPTLYVQLQARSDPRQRGRFLSCGLIILAVSLLIAGGAALPTRGAGTVFAGLAVCALLVAAWAYRCEAHLILRFLTWLLIHSFYRIGKSGFEHIPRSGPAVLVCNHVSFVDSVVIMAAIRRPIRFVMDHRIHQTPVVGFLFRHSRTIPIATAKEDPAMKEAAFEEVARALKNGELIGLFPEGRITHTGEINHFRYGVGRIVTETPVPVVPMALRGRWGSFFSRRDGPAMSRPTLLRWLAKVELVVGGPVAPENGTPEHLQEIVTELRGGMV